LALASGEIPSFLRASSHSSSLPCDSQEGHERGCVRPMSATQTSVTCTRTSCVPGELSRLSPRADEESFGAQIAFPGDPAFHDALLDRFGGSVIGALFPRGRFCACPAAWAFSSHDDDAIEPLTPLSPLSCFLGECTFVHIFQDLREPPRPIPPNPRDEARLGRPEVSSIDKDPSCVPVAITALGTRPTHLLAKMFRPLHGACHTMRGLGRCPSV